MASSSSEPDMDIDVSILEQVKKAISRYVRNALISCGSFSLIYPRCRVGAIEKDTDFSATDGFEPNRHGQGIVSGMQLYLALPHSHLTP